MVEAHPEHERCLMWLKRVRNREEVGIVSAHSLAEVYSILTTIPVSPKISPTDARQLLADNVLDVFEVVFLSDVDYVEVIGHLSELGIMGGATYDAVILRAAENAGVDLVVTLNEKDFRRVYPRLSDKIIAP